MEVASKLSGRRPLALVLIVATALVFTALMTMYAFGPPKLESRITGIETATQQTEGVTVTNYLPILAADVDWDQLSEGDRQDIARYAVNTAIQRATAEGNANFNVVGLTAMDRKTAFLYSSGGSLTIFAGGESLNVPLEQ